MIELSFRGATRRGIPMGFVGLCGHNTEIFDTTGIPPLRSAPCRNDKALAFFVAVVLAVCPLPRLRAQSIPTNWNDAARELARHTAEKTGTPSNVSLTVKSLSSLSAGDVAEIRRAVESQLNSAGMRLVKPDQSIADLQLTLSQNVQG